MALNRMCEHENLAIRIFGQIVFFLERIYILQIVVKRNDATSLWND